MRTLPIIFALAVSANALAGSPTRQEPNPAVVPVPQPGMERRHQEKVALISREKFDLLMIGDSITQNFEKPEFQPVWQQFFAPRHAINLGYSGGRTENTLWNLKNGELTGQSPKVVTLMIGTNNADERNYRTHHTAEQIAGGIEAIVALLRKELPDTKILLLACFPYGEQPAGNHRGMELIRTGMLIKPLADNRHVFFCNVNNAFLNPDGSMNKDLVPDYLHPNPAGALLWAKAMETTLSRLMGDKPRG
ncbi:GDSL-type esterase/lipase family protein [Fimbriimonas ginsengisoli]|uniref:Lipolytic protein G-D-S-L family n=1 Tax=Fimbriimonas ginsengisoli Gsoil 348 TaxID=661478 RepID=A0A068NT01_FIMGI|nr:GDSL-type esterase/lipase family protein [Fimbriimonas ginsengisoli]AIE84754.1 lipolytic protein G-D-S-L family [Fimbriimonas ginsengisoli Gsoil 348]